MHSVRSESGDTPADFELGMVSCDTKLRGSPGSSDSHLR